MKQFQQLAKRYAIALIEVCDNNIALQDTLIQELIVLSDSFEKIKGAKKIFENPGISIDEKKLLLKKVVGGKINIKLLNFLNLLIDKQRFNLLSDIQNQFNKLVNKNKGLVIAEVTTATQITPDELGKIKHKLETLIGKNEKVSIDSKVDSNLLGGIVVKMNDLVYDSSVKGRLENMKRRLLT